MNETIDAESVEKLRRWAGVMLEILDNASCLVGCGDEAAENIGHDIGEVVTEDFLKDMDDVFRKLYRYGESVEP